MKSLVSLIGLLVLLSGCGSDETPKKTPPPVQPPAQTQKSSSEANGWTQNHLENFDSICRSAFEGSQEERYAATFCGCYGPSIARAIPANQFWDNGSTDNAQNRHKLYDTLWENGVEQSCWQKADHPAFTQA